MDAKTPVPPPREAWEEAGVRGRVTGGCLGVYSYTKEMDGGEMLPVVAMLYPVEVKITADKYPEATAAPQVDVAQEGRQNGVRARAGAHDPGLRSARAELSRLTGPACAPIFNIS